MKKYYTFEYKNSKSTEVYKENGKYVSLYNYYDEKYHTKIINTPKLASEVSFVILKALMSKEFFVKNYEFNIISVNNSLWAIYDKSFHNLLLVIQKRDCKVLYVTNINTYDKIK